MDPDLIKILYLHVLLQKITNPCLNYVIVLLGCNYSENKRPHFFLGKPGTPSTKKQPQKQPVLNNITTIRNCICKILPLRNLTDHRDITPLPAETTRWVNLSIILAGYVSEMEASHWLFELKLTNEGGLIVCAQANQSDEKSRQHPAHFRRKGLCFSFQARHTKTIFIQTKLQTSSLRKVRGFPDVGLVQKYESFIY